MRVGAVVVSHGRPDQLATCLNVLRPQVDELLVVANIPGSIWSLPEDVRVLENRRPRGYGANVNAGVARLRADVVITANPDTIARPGAVQELVDVMVERSRCAVAGPQLLYPDGAWQPSRRRFPTVGGTLVRRTPIRWVADPKRHQRGHYLLDEQPSESVKADWMLGAFLLFRRSAFEELGGFDESFRLYGEDIDFCLRAAKAGWERWYVPSAVVEHEYEAIIDEKFLTRRTLWHFCGMFHFVRNHRDWLFVRRSQDSTGS